MFPFLCGLAAVVLSGWLFNQLTMGICKNRNSMAGKNVLITGGSDGIGFTTVVELAKRGARVIVGCRRVGGLKERILTIVPNAKIDVVKLDLTSTESVTGFANAVRAICDEIHVLINNAGRSSSSTLQLTADGQHEVTMATNYFGHVILNQMLMELLKKAGEGGSYSRLILVSSLKLFGGNLHAVDNFDLDGGKGPLQYNNSKQAQFLYCTKLAELFDESGINVAVSALHPGLVRTPIFNSLEPLARTKYFVLGWWLGKSCHQGAQTTIYLATEDLPREAFNGRYFMDCIDFTGWALKKAPKRVADRFWDRTLQLLSLPPPTF